MSRGHFSGNARDRDRGHGGARSSAITPLKGLFVDGIWHCNCVPRLPAGRFQTKKEGRNHGRWFYTCQKPQSERCNFFLWDDDAKLRETAAVLNNTRSEPVPDSERLSNQSSIPRSPPPPYSAFEVPGNIDDAFGPNSARTAHAEPFSDCSLVSGEEGRLFQVTENVAGNTAASRQRTIQQPETPRKATKADALDSPTKQWRSPSSLGLTALPTPSTEHRLQDVFTTSSTKTLSATPSAERITAQLLTPSVTPSPSRFRDIGAGRGDDSSLSEEILGILDKSCKLDNGTREKIKDICNKHSLRTQGIAKGRDISRLAIKTKEVKIAELQDRITSLEAQKESDMVTIRDLKRQLSTTEKPS